MDTIGRRIAVSENFNQSLKIEVHYDVKAQKFTFVYYKDNKWVDEHTVDKAFLDILKDGVKDIFDMNGKYASV